MLLLRAVVTGFGLAMGAAIFKKHVEGRLGLKEEPKPAAPAAENEAVERGTGDNLETSPS
jgi:hypothetical protein